MSPFAPENLVSRHGFRPTPHPPHIGCVWCTNSWREAQRSALKTDVQNSEFEFSREDCLSREPVSGEGRCPGDHCGCYTTGRGQIAQDIFSESYYSVAC